MAWAISVPSGPNSWASAVASWRPLAFGAHARYFGRQGANDVDLIAAGWVAPGAGADARSRLITILSGGCEKRQAAQRHWKSAQSGLNRLMGKPRLLALHALLDEALELLAPPTDSGHPE